MTPRHGGLNLIGGEKEKLESNLLHTIESGPRESGGRPGRKALTIVELTDDPNVRSMLPIQLALKARVNFLLTIGAQPDRAGSGTRLQCRTGRTDPDASRF